MKKQWQRLELKIDALNLRERALLFAVSALVLITLINTLMLDPLLDRQKQLSLQVRRDQQQIAAMQASIQSALGASAANPDAAALERLKNLRRQASEMQGDLQGLQGRLVSSDKMARLLEDILKENGKLHLVSLKKLPVVVLSRQENAEGKGEGQAGKPAPLPPAGKNEEMPRRDTVFQHSVEIVVQGGYLDIMDYLSQLEALPWQLFWKSARFEVESYPVARLTLTIFTLSLDKTWLDI